MLYLVDRVVVVGVNMNLNVILTVHWDDVDLKDFILCFLRKVVVKVNHMRVYNVLI